MSVEEVFNVRRHAYWRAWQYSWKVCMFGEVEGSASWCADKYVSHLVVKILRRKAQVDAARLEQLEITAQRPPSPPKDSDEERRLRRRRREILVHLINAVTGEGLWVVQMSRWAVLGDAIAKSNMQLDQSRASLRGVQEDGTPGGEDDGWYLVPRNEELVRCRIQDILEPNKEAIEIPVIKMPKTTSDEWPEPP